MKITSLILPVFVVAGMTTPAFCDDAQPVTAPVAAPADDAVNAVFDVTRKLIESQKTCADVLMAVTDAASAAEAAEVLRQEAIALDEARAKVGRDVTAIADSLESDPRAGQLEKELDEAASGLQMAVANMLNLYQPYFGCKELEEACKLYFDVLNGMSSAESDLMPQVVGLYKEFDMVRYDAWQVIASVTDRASADAASAKLAELAGLLNQSVGKLRALLEKLPDSEVDMFCMEAGSRYQEECPLPADFATVSKAAQDNIRKMGAMEPAFYGSPDLQERASMFVMMPR